ncbi:hypothetical protein scyTo_0008384 [Scyliorhinus torazame]|uniref:SH3 domain-containing protein n=1 Tax=Scyliorhinus torazame TaxID=75743 RepID=A0A401P8G2_SCYTO|nr:hypothetical protein [Scyliorhinus torazame]
MPSFSSDGDVQGTSSLILKSGMPFKNTGVGKRNIRMKKKKKGSITANFFGTKYQIVSTCICPVAKKAPTGLVPYNYLEPLKPEKGERSPPPDIPAPPTTTAPEKPAGVKDENSLINTSQRPIESSKTILSKDHLVPVPSIVKVHFKYTVAIRVKPGLSHNELLAVISKKLHLPDKRLELSYKSRESGELTPITNETKMKNMWAEVGNQRLTIWCKFPEVVALFDYEVSVPADLGFHEGDIIHVLAQVNNNWLEGQCKGNTGIFPATFVKELSMVEIMNSGM